jgi:hypothetical protein
MKLVTQGGAYDRRSILKWAHDRFRLEKRVQKDDNERMTFGECLKAAWRVAKAQKAGQEMYIKKYPKIKQMGREARERNEPRHLPRSLDPESQRSKSFAEGWDERDRELEAEKPLRERFMEQLIREEENV